MNMFKKNGGFTLVELIVVIAILAILAGVAVPVYSGYISKANEAADYTLLDSVKTAAIFAAMEKNPNVVIDEITITITSGSANATAVSVGHQTLGTGEGDAVTSVDISDYIGADTMTFKSKATEAKYVTGTKVTGNLKSGWNLTIPTT